MSQQVIVFGKASSLVGTIHDPPPGGVRAETPAVILLNAGMVHRVGPNRLYVKLARELAQRGHVVMRFDFSGFGDSTVRQDHLPMAKCVVDETQEAMNHLQTTRGCRQFVLMGICSGATASLKTAACDPRVAGAVLINVRAGGDELKSYIKGRSAVRKYWNFAVNNRGRWLAAIRERMHLQGVVNVVRALRHDVRSAFRSEQRSFPEAERAAEEMSAAMSRGARLMVVCSEWDPGLDFMKIVLEENGLRNYGEETLRVVTVPEADHTFTPMQKQRELMNLVLDWTAGVSPAPHASGALGAG